MKIIEAKKTGIHNQISPYSLKLHGLKAVEFLCQIASLPAQAGIRPKQKNFAFIHGLKTIVFCKGGIKHFLMRSSPPTKLIVYTSIVIRFTLLAILGPTINNIKHIDL